MYVVREGVEGGCNGFLSQNWNLVLLGCLHVQFKLLRTPSQYGRTIFTLLSLILTLWPQAFLHESKQSSQQLSRVLIFLWEFRSNLFYDLEQKGS